MRTSHGHFFPNTTKKARRFPALQQREKRAGNFGVSVFLSLYKSLKDLHNRYLETNYNGIKKYIKTPIFSLISPEQFWIIHQSSHDLQHVAPSFSRLTSYWRICAVKLWEGRQGIFLKPGSVYLTVLATISIWKPTSFVFGRKHGENWEQNDNA